MSVTLRVHYDVGPIEETICDSWPRARDELADLYLTALREGREIIEWSINEPSTMPRHHAGVSIVDIIDASDDDDPGLFDIPMAPRNRFRDILRP